MSATVCALALVAVEFCDEESLRKMSKRGQRRDRPGRPLDETRAASDTREVVGPADGSTQARRTIDPDHSLFHYTTATGLVGIVESKTLWATHASFLNDTAERQLLSALLAPQIRGEFEKIVPELTTRGAFKPELLSQLGADGMPLASIDVSRVLPPTQCVPELTTNSDQF
jgi:hypothetical protein